MIYFHVWDRQELIWMNSDDMVEDEMEEIELSEAWDECYEDAMQYLQT